jgi:hypothetical protein
MQMPRFTAEQSLYRTRGQHKFKTDFADSSSKAAITAQRIKLHTVYCDCDSDGYCVCDDGSELNDWTGMLELRY